MSTKKNCDNFQLRNERATQCMYSESLSVILIVLCDANMPHTLPQEERTQNLGPATMEGLTG